MTSIGKWAFVYCDGLTSVISKIKNPYDIDDLVFWGKYDSATLYVPEGTTELYKAVNGWKNFANIVEGEPTGIHDVRKGTSEVFDV